MEKGADFYSLRRTAATLTTRSGDPFAVQRLLGHADFQMATTYVQDVSEQTDRAINNTRKLIIQNGSSPLADASSGKEESQRLGTVKGRQRFGPPLYNDPNKRSLAMIKKSVLTTSVFNRSESHDAACKRATEGVRQRR